MLPGVCLMIWFKLMLRTSVCRLTTKSQFVALLYGRLSGAEHIWEFVGALESHTAWLYHRGLRRMLGDVVYLVDSTDFRLSGMGPQWPYFSIHASSGNVRVIYGTHTEKPVYAADMHVNVNEVAASSGSSKP